MKYTIGLDYGTLSVRAVLVDSKTGQEIAVAVYPYPHGVMDQALPCGTPLPPDFALQDPDDYVQGLRSTVRSVLEQAGVSAQDVIGIGIDFTACTVLPVDASGVPLCKHPEFASEPHAYVKLWKHHAAQEQADAINALARERQENWLRRYGGIIGSEWEFPKLLEVLQKCPRVYEQTAHWCEAADWIVWQLTGSYTKNACCAGFKGMWSKQDGYPSEDFFAQLHPQMRHVIRDKMQGEVLFPGQCAGRLDARGAELTGLRVGTAVAVPVIDAHAALPACQIVDDGAMLAIVGTSTCHISLGQEQPIDGICGVVQDGVIPGHFAYESGQACVGDHFQWVVEHIVPQAYFREAQDKGISVYRLMDEKAEQIPPGANGLVALDWFNGNRSTLMNSRLTGAIVGLKLSTTAEDIYRALIEATAFGTKTIVDNYLSHGIPVDTFVLAGGIVDKSDFVTQLYCDVLNRPVRVCASGQAGALGSAIYASAAAGSKAGGYDSVSEAARAMGRLKDKVYTPDPQRAAVYDALYRQYRELYTYFGTQSHMMEDLRAIAQGTTPCKH